MHWLHVWKDDKVSNGIKTINGKTYSLDALIEQPAAVAQSLIHLPTCPVVRGSNPHQGRL